MRHFISVVLMGTLMGWASVGSTQAPVFPGAYQQNAAFLSRRFVADVTQSPRLTADFLSKTDTWYKTPLLFPNGGLLSALGVLDHAPRAATRLLAQVRAYETAHGVAFTLLPSLNGYSLQDTVHAANLRLDLANPVVRAHIVTECGRYVSATVPGSYVSGAPRVFDGIMLDIEPAGDRTFVALLKTLLDEIRASFDALGLPQTTIGVAAPQYTDRTPKPTWGWNAFDYHYVARHVQYIMAMTYDSGVKTHGGAYQAWIAQQTTQILQAVSGAAWGFDPLHPPPLQGGKVLLGLPGFHTVTTAHDPSIENVAYGAPGIVEGLSRLRTTDRTSLRYYQGAAMYTHDGGAADSLYARYNEDWWWWGTYWLGYTAPW